MPYRIDIGLEVHLQLRTETKVFCSCPVKFGALPNTQTCPVCLGFPGSLPVLNEKALEYAVKVALALNCTIENKIKFDRKNYYYADLPKNFQISQFDMPIGREGRIDIVMPEGRKKIRIKRVHLEEDAGKLIHKGAYSLIDYNRAGTPLLEIVSEPDMASPQEAYEYLLILKSILAYLDVSDCNMEEGSLRCDANISLRPEGCDSLGTKNEIKNMNTFKGVKSALEYEVTRQSVALKEGSKIVQMTRLWDADKRITTAMRSKEESHDYRYFPEPDLVPFTIAGTFVERVRESLPELPEIRRMRFIKDFGLSTYEAELLSRERRTADFFEETQGLCRSPKAVANWIMGDISRILNERHMELSETKLAAVNLSDMIKLIENGTISSKIAKSLIEEMMESGEAPGEIISKKGLTQISDESALEGIIDRVIKENQKSVTDYKNGKKNALGYMVGQVMKATAGKANPKLVNELLHSKLS